MFDALILGMAGAPEQGADGLANYGPLIFFGFIFLVFYVLLIAPARKRERELGSLRENLSPGDEVVLSCGIFGTVLKIEDNNVQLRIGENTRIKVLKSAIDARTVAAVEAQKKS